MAEELTEVTPELIEQLTELARTGELTAKDLEGLSAAAKKQKSTMEELGKATIQASKSFAKGFANATASVASGATEIDTMKTIVSAAGEAMASLLEAIPFVGKALAGLTRAAVQVANLAIDRLQVSFNAFQELSKQGLIGAKGISGLREQMIRARIPMEKWQNILGKNSEALAYFSGSALKGSETLSEVMFKMQDGQGMQLRRLGFSIEEIGDTVVDFQKTHRRMGILTQMSTNDLVKSSTEYGRELDMIAKLTGQSRKEAQANREKLLADTRFRAWMNQQNTAEGKKRVQAVGDFIGGIQKMAPMMAEGMKDLFASGGVATTQAGQRLIQQGMGPTVMRIKRMMMDGSMSQADAQRELFKAALQNRDKFRDLSAIVGDFGAGIPYQEMADLAKAQGMSKEEIDKMVKGQKSQMSGQDKLTDQLTKTVMNLQEAQTKLDALATTADLAGLMVKTFSDALLAVSRTLFKMTGLSDDEITGVMRAKDEASKAQGLGVKGKVVGEGKEAKFVVSEKDYQAQIDKYNKIGARVDELSKKKGKLTQAEKDELETLKEQQKREMERMSFMRSHLGSAGRGYDANKAMFYSRDKRRGPMLGTKLGNLTDEEEIRHFMQSMGLTTIGKGQDKLIANVLQDFQKNRLKGTKFEGDLEYLQDRVQAGDADAIKLWNELKGKVQQTGAQSAQLDAYNSQRQNLEEYIKKAKADGVIDDKEKAYIESQEKHLNTIAGTLVNSNALTAEALRKQQQTLEELKKLVQK